MTQTYVVDHLGRQVLVPSQPQRIISLVPSQTELLADLDLEQQVLGITKFCVRPQHWRKNKTIVGGTKQVHFDRIQALQPDLIIANKEENERAMIETLAEQYPVWLSDVKDLSTALDMIVQVGHITDRAEQANALKNQVKTRFEQLDSLLAPQKPLRAAYLIWRNPLMVAGGDTFIHDMLYRAGYQNVFAERSRYPTISEAELAATHPDLIFLSSEPFPFKQKHLTEFQEICRQAVVHLVDGESFSWYGSRLLQAPSYFRNLRTELAI